MKIVCKCGEVLTPDLFLAKRMRIDQVLKDYKGDGWHKIEKSVRRGSFLRQKWWGEYHLSVHPLDVPNCQDQFVYKPGRGCCGVNGRLYCPSCDEEIGGIALDCYHDKSIYFYERKVQRLY